MSSIIDALKKSDNNRSTETGVPVNQVKFGNEPPKRSRRGFWLLVLFLMLVAAAVFAWQQGWHHALVNKAQQWMGSQETTVQTEAMDTEIVNNKAKPVTNTQPSNNQTKSPTQANPKSNNNKLTPPKADEVKSKSIENDVKKSQIVAAEQSRKAGEDKDQKIAEELNDDNTSVVDEERKKQLSDNEEIKPVIEDRTVLEPQMKQDYLLLHQIDFEVRKNIPPIKLNIHIYDPEPDNRMVMINGVRFIIGDVIDELVTVIEIVQDGVVLEYEKIRFLVPK